MAIRDGSGEHVSLMGGSAPTLAAGANNGTTPPAPVVTSGSTDARGRCTFGSGGSAALGSQVTVTFAQAYEGTPVVMAVAENNATALLDVGVGSVTPQGFNIITGTAPTASQANTVYAAAWLVIG